MRALLRSLAAALLAGCAAIPQYHEGLLQPQSVSGPCDVGHFFFLDQRTVPTTMTVSNNGQACTFTLVNPALNAVIDASILSGRASHGQAQTGLINGARQVAVAYTPAPGYAGPDRFDVTLEPGAVGVTVDVTVR